MTVEQPLAVLFTNLGHLIGLRDDFLPQIEILAQTIYVTSL